MSLLRLPVAFTLLMFAAACGSGDSSPPLSPSPAPSEAPSPSGRTASIAIPVGAEFLGSGGFAPTQLTVDVGTTVTWMNSDRDSHTSTSDVPGWNSGTISPGRPFSFTFTTTGTFPYHCSFHPGMTGTVAVR
jgi:plastocyanin